MEQDYLKKGFTLIELLIIIAIIALLATVLLVSLSSSREKANIASYKSQADSLVPAIINRCITSTVTAADVNTLIGFADGDSRRKIGPSATLTASSSCGPNGSGTFTVNINSVDLGVSTSANACENIGGTVLKETGIVTFPAGCM